MLMKYTKVYNPVIIINENDDDGNESLLYFKKKCNNIEMFNILMEYIKENNVLEVNENDKEHLK